MYLSLCFLYLIFNFLFNSVAFAAGLVNPNTLSIPSGHIFNAAGDVTNSGTLTDNGVLSLTGNWTSTGNFNAGAGDVVLKGAAGTAQVINGSNTFYKLTRTTGGVNLTFEAGATQTIQNLTLTGAENNLITLRSSTAGTQWKIDPQGTRVVSYVDVKDSNNLNAAVIEAAYSTDSGNNINWFTAATTTSTTSISTTTTTTVPGATTTTTVSGATTTTVMTTTTTTIATTTTTTTTTLPPEPQVVNIDTESNPAIINLNIGTPQKSNLVLVVYDRGGNAVAQREIPNLDVGFHLIAIDKQFFKEEIYTFVVIDKESGREVFRRKLPVKK